MCASDTVLWAAVPAMAASSLPVLGDPLKQVPCLSTKRALVLQHFEPSPSDCCPYLLQHKNISKVDYAMQSLKRAMKWDEVTAPQPTWLS